MSASRARWAVALRIARRSAVKSWGRSLLVMVLIAVPVGGLAAGALVLQSTMATTGERLTTQLGRTQAMLVSMEGRKAKLIQSPLDAYAYNDDANNPQDTGTPLDPRSLLPAGTRVLTLGTTAAIFTTPTGVGSLTVETGPTWDPSLRGAYELVSGRAPTRTDEVTVSPAALVRLGVHVGDTVQLVKPVERTVHVVGVETSRRQPADRQSVFVSAALLPATDDTPSAFTYYLPTHRLDWAAVQRMNQVGVTALSREVALDPPPDAPDFSGGGASAANIVVVCLVLVFAVLEVALLAGAAFAVGARLQQRALATIASVGAPRATLIRVVTASGVVLGFAGGVLGLGLGTLVGGIFMRLTDDGSATTYPGFHVPIGYYAAILVFGVVVGWISALLPARAASKFDVVRALRGARPPAPVGRKRPVVGVVLMVGGVIASLAGGTVLLALTKTAPADPTLGTVVSVVLLGGGPLLTQVGALLCTGLILRTLSRALSRMPLGTRLAARDTSRNLGRSVPAVAAVMTTVFVAVFGMCIGNAVSASQLSYHAWQSDLRQATSSIRGTDGARPTDAVAAQWSAAITSALPVTRYAILRSPDNSGVEAKHPSSTASDAIPQIPNSYGNTYCDDAQRSDPKNAACGRFAGGVQSTSFTIEIGSAADLAVLLDHPVSQAALTTLASGGAVALRTNVLEHGKARVEWFTPKQLTGDGTAKPVRVSTIPAVVDLPAQPLSSVLFLGSVGADRLGIRSTPDSVVASLSRYPTDRELDAANAAVGAVANEPDASYLVQVERGPQYFGDAVAWLVLLVCLVIALSAGATAIGLARVDGKADDLTFTSVGAPPRIRRSIAFAQGLIICGTGGVIGAVLGLLPAAAVGSAVTSLAFSPPWLQVGLTIVGIPIVIACGSWLLVGNRAPLGRRLAVA